MNQKYNILCESLFKQKMQEVRKKGKDLIYKMSKESLEELKRALYQDLSKNYIVKNIEMKLARFRGITYIRTCNIIVVPKNGQFVSEDQVEPLLAHLIDVYSPKFKLRKLSGGEAHFKL